MNDYTKEFLRVMLVVIAGLFGVPTLFILIMWWTRFLCQTLLNACPAL